MPRMKEHGALVDVLSGGGIMIQPATGKNITLDGKVNCGLDAGANDTYVITLDPVPSAYFAGQEFKFKANTANTGAATLNVNGLGAKTIKKVAGGITTDLATSDIRAGQYVHVVYDGTNFQMLSASGNATAAPGDVPVKASGAEVNTGTDDAKFVTAKAIADSFLDGLVSALGAFIPDPTDEASNVVATSAILDLLIAKGLMAAS